MAPALGTAATLIPAGSCDLFPSASGRTKASTTTSRSTAFATTATT
ncbi:hypothetical protein AB0M50_07555 [Nonomuraea fuscirosea]|nr:hypothetical protein [Nonomuraea fuscirosea]WSA53062.1 hypothetical protein OIE67_00025 [Nonomuraea fuscirosea]